MRSPQVLPSLLSVFRAAPHPIHFLKRSRNFECFLLLGVNSDRVQITLKGVEILLNMCMIPSRWDPDSRERQLNCEGDPLGGR